MSQLFGGTAPALGAARSPHRPAASALPAFVCDIRPSDGLEIWAEPFYGMPLGLELASQLVNKIWPRCASRFFSGGVWGEMRPLCINGSTYRAAKGLKLKVDITRSYLESSEFVPRRPNEWRFPQVAVLANIERSGSNW